MKHHWRRTEPQFFDIFALDWKRGIGPALTHGVDARLVTRDEGTEASTLMVSIPPGWRHVEQGTDGTLEIFVLEGDLSADGKSVGCTGFVVIPLGCGPVELSSVTGCQAYVWLEPTLPVDYYYDGGQLQVRKIWQEPWTPSVMPGLQHGIMHKSLRLPDPAGGLVHGGPGGMLRLVLMAPGFGETRQEVHHDCWEEIIWLSGDFLMPGRGLHKAGSLLNNPAELPHGGLTTQKGTVMLLHCNAPMGADFVPVPHGQAMVDKYLDNASWLAEPEHRDWEHCHEFHVDETAHQPELVR